MSRMIKYREVTNTLLIASMLAAILTFIIAGLWFSYPILPTVIIGSTADFPPSSSPYWVEKGEDQFYVVNTDRNLIIFVPRTTHPTVRCRLIWNRDADRFEDPCLSTKFSLTGEWIDGPTWRNLDRYVYRIEHGQITVEMYRIVKGESID
jgi:hypothetical protein